MIEKDSKAMYVHLYDGKKAIIIEDDSARPTRVVFIEKNKILKIIFQLLYIYFRL